MAYLLCLSKHSRIQEMFAELIAIQLEQHGTCMQVVRINLNVNNCTPQILTYCFIKFNFLAYQFKVYFWMYKFGYKVVRIVNSDANQNVRSKYVRESTAGDK